MGATTFILTARVVIDLNGVSSAVIHDRLIQAIQQAMQIGGVTGNTAAMVEAWECYSAVAEMRNGRDYNEEWRCDDTSKSE